MKPCAHQDPGEGVVTPQEMESDLPVSASGSPTEGKGCQQPAMGTGVVLAVLVDASWYEFS